MAKKNGSLGLNIFGSSGNGMIHGMPLYLQANLGSGLLPLVVQNKFNKSGILKANTNYDFSLSSPEAINNVSNANLEFTWKDYSSNKFDTYYYTNRGAQAVDYTMSADWSISDIAVKDDIMAVGTSDWTSFEKYMMDFSENPSIYSAYISPIQLLPIPAPTTETVTVYNYSVVWSTMSYCSLTSAGTLTLQYTDAYGNTQQISAYISNSNSGSIGPISSRENQPTIVSFTGSPGSWASFIGGGCLNIPTYTTSTVTITTNPTLPPGAIILDGTHYFVPDANSFRLSKFIIPSLAQLLQDPTKKWMDYNSTEFEVPDYSDIFIDIIYSTISPVDSQNINAVSTSTERTYKFGGFVRYNDFISGLFDTTLISHPTTIDNNTDFYWYIIVQDDGSYSHIGLSDWVYFDWTGTVNFNDFPEYSSAFLTPDYLVADWRKINITIMNVYKIAPFFNCGKVDLYTIKTGIPAGVSGDVVHSYNHRLNTGQRIKIVGALSTGTADASVTNANGLWYVKVIDDNYFRLYSDPDLLYSANIVNLKNPTGISWTAIDGNTWKYNTTLYSPCGKNGYGFNTKLRSFNEPDTLESDPYLRSIESDRYDDDLLKPQADFTGQRSWTNFYPTQRFNNNDEQVFGVFNGNRFGNQISIKKYGSSYIMMVSEPGAIESFQIFDDFILESNTILPKNQKVVPNYFPYGKVHFYKINDITNIEYLTTVTTSDNPWVQYESLNKQERLLSVINTFNNAPITSEEITNYGYTTDSYWVNSRFFSWQKNTNYNSIYNIELPDQNAFPLEFGFVDSFGKTSDFEIENEKIYGFASTNVKDSDYINNLKNNNVDMIGKFYSFDINSSSNQNIYNISFPCVYESSDRMLQRQEIQLFGSTVSYNNKKLVVGWPSINRDQEYIYYLNRSNNNLTITQIITSSGNNNFGKYFVTDEQFLVTHKNSQIDEKSKTTVNPLPYIQVYKYYSNDNLYLHESSLSPTIDLSNNVYNNVNPDTYEVTSNLSYDGTSNNSATYIIDLANKYDIYNGLLLIRDWNEYACFQYNWNSKKFEPKYHRFSQFNTDASILKLTSTSAAALYDASGDYQSGQYSQSLNIIDGVQDSSVGLLNYILIMDMQSPNGLPLYLKTIDGYSSGNMTLYTIPYVPNNSGIQLYSQGPLPKSGNIDLFLEMYNPSSGNLPLFHKSISLSSGNLNLFTKNYITTGNVPLYIDNGHLNNHVPLVLYWPTYYGYNKLDLSLDNHYEGSPNSSGSLSLTIKPPTGTIYAGISLNINPSGSTGLAYSSSGDLPVYINASNPFGNIDLYTNSSGSSVFNKNYEFPLFIKLPTMANLDLFVYNNMQTANTTLYVSGIYGKGQTIPLYVSGVDYPGYKMPLYVRSNGLP